MQKDENKKIFYNVQNFPVREKEILNAFRYVFTNGVKE